MSAVYPAGPTDVPADLTSPTRTYRRHAWLAVAGLALFVTAYFGLATWFGWTAWRLLANLANGNSGNLLAASLVAGTCAAFLAVFMLKALVSVKRGEAADDDLEVKPAEQPALFEFLHRLAAETGAPRPHRVYLSSRVNAAVFYDLSVANLLLPSRKNLEIGLPLVNVLTLGELKAVLAHEFGHFAQKSMAVGRWVYVAQQIAGHIVARRDALDAFLVKLSGIDLRIAWVGWMLRLIVWSIRSLVDLLFRVIVIAQRALSREMEFQADLVAVSVTGSDALIHALHKLGAADDAWDRTLAFANGELQEKRGVRDLFAIQAHVIRKLRSLLGDENYGVAPPLPTTQPEAHRIFEVALAAPPRMWATHPANSDREANAKRRYIRADIDDRSAWTLFADAQALRERVSNQLTRQADCAPASPEESLARLEQQYSRGFFNAGYRGAYLGRSIVRHARELDELYGHSPAPEQLLRELDALYPPTLTAEIERLRKLEDERQMLIALREGILTAPGGVIRHRGMQFSRKELPRILDAVEHDVEECALRVREHDRRCRATHLAVARSLGDDWGAYLRGLLGILHYADHVEANLLDAHGLLSHTVAIATADGKVSKGELQKILHAADTTYAALKDIHDTAGQVLPDRTVLTRMKVESWAKALETFQLPAPDANIIGDWLNVIGGWVRSTSTSLSALRLAALEQLLAAETQVALFLRRKMKPAAAPPASIVPREYRLLLPGTERPRQARLTWFDRFHMASGIVPTAARVATAAVIIGVMLYVASGVGTSTVYVFNGLARNVVAELNDARVPVAAGSHVAVDIGQAEHLHILTRTTDGKTVEEFDADTEGSSSQVIYNVAAAGALVSWVATYGSSTAPPEKMLGTPRWMHAHANFVLEEPPASVKTRGGKATRSVLSGVGDAMPAHLLSAIENEAERNTLITTHALWDDSNSRGILQWLGLALSLPDFEQILETRLNAEPAAPVYRRVEQDSSTGAAHDAVCEKHRQLAADAPDNADLQYIATRCLSNPEERDRAFLDLLRRWPDNGWIALAGAYVHAGEAHWPDALRLMSQASQQLPPMQDSLDIELARIERVLAGPGGPDLRKLQRRSEYLRVLLSTESGEPPPGIWRAYASLGRGELDAAIDAKDVSEAEQARLLRLAAASDGASRTLIERALALPPEAGLDQDTFLPALSLATRNRRDVNAYLRLAPKIVPRDSDKVLKVYATIRRHVNRADIEAAMRGLEPRMRGQAYVAAAILRGADCPREWRAAARQLLFVSERPFLR